jgi:hypothetical protein
MAFQTHLENLRAKPEHIRKRIAFWSSFGITAIIFMFWLGSFSVSGSTAKGAVATAVAKAGSPGSSLIAGVGNFFIDIKEMIFGAKKINYSEVEVRAGDK